MDNSEKFEKNIKKSISKGVKYLLKYRLNLIEEQQKQPSYDGGVTILMSYMQGHYGIDFGFEKNCNNLVKCAQDYIIDHPRPMFNKNKKENDLFDTNFLRDIYLQKNNQYTLNVYIEKMEKYIQSGDGLITKLMPILDIFSQREIRYLNVGLALFGLMEKNYEKVKKNKGFLHLKKRICRELADIFNNTSNNDPHQLDTVKSYAIFLLHLLEEGQRVDDEDYKKFVVCLLRTQNSVGQWIHSDSYDSVNEINNSMLTIFSIINLLNYYKRITDSELTENTDNTDNTMKSNTIEGFEGGFLTQKNMDAIFASKVCTNTLVELGTLLFMIIIFIYLMIKLYQRRNI
jgi:hypothetical protein